MRRRVLTGLTVLVWMAGATGALAQAAAQAPAPAPAAVQSVAGKYGGTAVRGDGPMPVTAELKVEDGVITGSITTNMGPVTVTSGSLTGDQLALNIDMNGLTGTVRGLFRTGKFDGQWALGGDSGSVTLARVADAAAAPGSTPAAAAATGAAAGGDPLTGDWDAVIDFGGNQMPFTLSLKLEGERVTGQTASNQGSVPIEGTWTNGTLSFSVSTGQGGAIVMTATLIDGKLGGTFTGGDGQFTGGWAAAKRK